MKKSYKIVIRIISTIVILWGIIFFIDYCRCSKLKEPIFVISQVTENDGNSGTYYGLGYKIKMEKTIYANSAPQLTKVEMFMFDKFIVGSISDVTNIGENDNIVIIKNYEIENEILIDQFIEKAVYSNSEDQEIDIIQDDTKIKVKYTSGEYAKTKKEARIVTNSGDGSYESNKRIYGYYSLIINDELKGEYPLVSHIIKRNMSDNKVTLYFDAPFIEYTKIPEICKYSLESSNYSKKYDLTYLQRKDMGIKNIYDTEKYSIKTFGGDVLITIEEDMVYTLKDALNKKVISPDDIITQAKMDLKYGICQESFYSDGGSVEYCYYGEPENQYTILKLNTLEDYRDLIIGMRGNIINLYNKHK